MIIAGEVEGLKCHAYINLVAKVAWKHWQRLPAHTRSWISIEDMILDGIRWAETKGMKRWDRRKGAATTVIYIGLSNYYDMAYIEKYCRGNKKRSEHSTISIDAVQQEYRDEGMNLELETVLGLPVSSPKEIEAVFLPNGYDPNCLAVEHMVTIYNSAPAELKRKIRDWFLAHAWWQQKEPRWHLESPKFREQATRFRRLADRNGLTIHECRHLISSPLCLDQLSRHVTLGLPYGGSMGW